MSFSSLSLTDSGKGIIVKALSGAQTINFTKFQIGNGVPDDESSLTALQNPLKDVSIQSIETDEGIAVLTGSFDNSELDSGFYWKELGIYATDEDIGEVLYAYANAGDQAEYLPAYTGTNYIQTTLKIAVVVGDATEVSATIGEYTSYATTAQLKEHTENKDNPHGVTKEQIGLSNVENYSFSNAPIIFSTTTSLSTISSGDTVASVFSKIRLLISNFLTHTSATNPHNITCSAIGAAKSSHSHSASDITSGTLGIARGGTGATTAASAAANILAAGAKSIGGNMVFEAVSTGFRGMIGYMAQICGWRIGGQGDTTGDGELEIASEGTTAVPVVVRQYSDIFVTAKREATLLDTYGNTSFPGIVSATSHTTTSDLKKKNVHGKLSPELSKKIIMGMKPIAYKFKDSTRESMGFGAQDAYKLMQELGVKESALYTARRNDDKKKRKNKVLTDRAIKKTEDEKLDWTMDYQQLIAPLVSLVQQQQKEIDNLKERMEALTNGIS